ncbi:ABC transporter substrate-binding protein [Streptosporangium lutulentum]
MPLCGPGNRGRIVTRETAAHEHAPSPPGAERTDGSSVQIGALVPLTRPGWVDAGRHLLAGLELAVRDVNDAGGIAGRPLELVVRDTAADPQRAAAAVDELARLGVAAVAGSITASSLAPPPPGPTPSACRSSARRRFSTSSPNSRRDGSRASPRRSPTAGRSTRTSSSARGTAESR